MCYKSDLHNILWLGHICDIMIILNKLMIINYAQTYDNSACLIQINTGMDATWFTAMCHKNLFQKDNDYAVHLWIINLNNAMHLW